MGCSTGPELYSVLWSLRSARPDMTISAIGADVREDVVAKARDATYSLHDDEVIRLSDAKIEALFDHVGDGIRVKEWIRKDTRWVVADALDPQLRNELGAADLLVANNFIGAMPDEVAERCLENLLGLISSGGYFAFNGELDLKRDLSRSMASHPWMIKSKPSTSEIPGGLDGPGRTMLPNQSISSVPTGRADMGLYLQRRAASLNRTIVLNRSKK